MSTHQALSKMNVYHAVDCWLIGPKVTEEMTLAGCAFAKQRAFACITVKPCYLRSAMRCLRGSGIAVGTVIGYPFGAGTSQAKIAEVKRTLSEGVHELALFPNLGYLIEGSIDAYIEELQKLIGLAHLNGAKTKTILDQEHMSDEQLIDAVEALKKTNTDQIYLYFSQPWSTSMMAHFALLQGIFLDEKLVGIWGDFNLFEELENLLSAGCKRVGFEGIPTFL